MPRRYRALALLIAAVTVFSVPETAPAGGDEDDVNPLGRGAAVAAKGRALYNNTCTICHGPDGAAGGRGPALAASRRYVRRTDSELFDAVVKGIAGTEMPATGLAPGEAWAIVAYIRSLRAVAAEVSVPGDRGRGAEVFWSEKQGRCGRCHMIRGRGGRLGPDLSDLGAEMSLARIREALTLPRPHPSRGYRPVTVVTRDGREISGVAKNEHNFSIQILGEDDRLHLFIHDEIEEIRFDDRPLMPRDYDERLSGTEFQNLLAYLSRLTLKPPSEAASMDEPAIEGGEQ